MNNTSLKNAYYDLSSIKTLPYGNDINDVILGGTNLNSIELNGSFNQLVQNDIYIEKLNDYIKSEQYGPNQYDSYVVDKAPDGYKVVDNRIKSDKLSIYRKQIRPINDTIQNVLQCGIVYGMGNFGNIFIVASEKGMFWTIDGQEFNIIKEQTTNSPIFASTLYVGKYIFFSDGTDIYNLTITIDDNNQYIFIKKKINKYKLNDVSTICYFDATSELYIGANGGTVYCKISSQFDEMSMYNIEMIDLQYKGQVRDFAINNNNILATTDNGLYISTIRNTVERLSFLSGKKINFIIDNRSINNVLIGTDDGVYTPDGTKITTSYQGTYCYCEVADGYLIGSDGYIIKLIKNGSRFEEQKITLDGIIGRITQVYTSSTNFGDAIVYKIDIGQLHQSVSHIKLYLISYSEIIDINFDKTNIRSFYISKNDRMYIALTDKLCIYDKIKIDVVKSDTTIKFNNLPIEFGGTNPFKLINTTDGKFVVVDKTSVYLIDEYGRFCDKLNLESYGFIEDFIDIKSENFYIDYNYATLIKPEGNENLKVLFFNDINQSTEIKNIQISGTSPTESFVGMRQNDDMLIIQTTNYTYFLKNYDINIDETDSLVMKRLQTYNSHGIVKTGNDIVLHTDNDLCALYSMYIPLSSNLLSSKNVNNYVNVNDLSSIFVVCNENNIDKILKYSVKSCTLDTIESEDEVSYIIKDIVLTSSVINSGAIKNINDIYYDLNEKTLYFSTDDGVKTLGTSDTLQQFAYPGENISRFRTYQYQELSVIPDTEDEQTIVIASSDISSVVNNNGLSIQYKSWNIDNPTDFGNLSNIVIEGECKWINVNWPIAYFQINNSLCAIIDCNSPQENIDIIKIADNIDFCIDDNYHFVKDNSVYHYNIEFNDENEQPITVIVEKQESINIIDDSVVLNAIDGGTFTITVELSDSDGGINTYTGNYLDSVGTDLSGNIQRGGDDYNNFNYIVSNNNNNILMYNDSGTYQLSTTKVAEDVVELHEYQTRSYYRQLSNSQKIVNLSDRSKQIQFTDSIHNFIFNNNKIYVKTKDEWKSKRWDENEEILFSDNLLLSTGIDDIIDIKNRTYVLSQGKIFDTVYDDIKRLDNHYNTLDLSSVVDIYGSNKKYDDTVILKVQNENNYSLYDYYLKSNTYKEKVYDIDDKQISSFEFIFPQSNVVENNVLLKYDNKLYVKSQYSIDEMKFLTPRNVIINGFNSINNKYVFSTTDGVYLIDGKSRNRRVFDKVRSTIISENLTNISKFNDVFFVGSKDNGLYRLYFSDDDIIASHIRNISNSVNAIEVFDYNGITKTVAIGNENTILTSDNGRQFTNLITIQDKPLFVYNRNKNEFYFGTNNGLYRTQYQYDLVDDTYSYSAGDIKYIVDSQISDIIFNVDRELSAHIEQYHNKESFITRINEEKTDISASTLKLEQWCKLNDTEDESVMYIENDIVNECEFGDQDTGDIYISHSNYISDIEQDNFQYIMKRWYSGITELYIHIPSTDTYYLSHTQGSSFNKIPITQPYKRDNLLNFGEEIAITDSQISSHVTNFSIHIADTLISIDDLLEIQANGMSLPLKIYKDQHAFLLEGESTKMFKSTIIPTSVISVPKDKDDKENGDYVFNFICFGTDEQAVKLTFFDKEYNVNDTYTIAFHPNGAPGNVKYQSMPVAFETPRRLRRCPFKYKINGQKSFIGWSFDNTSTQIIDDEQRFNWKDYEDRIGQVKKGTMINLYAMWADVDDNYNELVMEIK